jgi:hypothetical protein
MTAPSAPVTGVIVMAMSAPVSWSLGQGDGMQARKRSAADRRNGRLRQEISAYLARGVKAGSWLEESLFRLVVTSLERAQSAGEIAPRHDPPATAHLLLTALSGFLHIENEPPDERAARARDMVRLLLDGLRADPARVSSGEP